MIHLLSCIYSLRTITIFYQKYPLDYTFFFLYHKTSPDYGYHNFLKEYDLASKDLLSGSIPNRDGDISSFDR